MKIKNFSLVLTALILSIGQHAQAEGACAPAKGRIEKPSTSYFQNVTYSNGVWNIWGDAGEKKYSAIVNLSTPFRISYLNGLDVAYDLDGPAGKIYRLYSMFNKKPDMEGFGYWIGESDRCLTIEQIAHSFMQTPMYATLYGINSTNKSFLTTLYSQVFRRSPDDDGLNYWLGRLNDGMSRLNVILNFTEHEANKAYVYSTISHGISYYPYNGMASQQKNILKSPF